MFARVELLKTTPSTVSKSRPSKKQTKSRSNTKSKDLLRTVRSRAINTLRNPQYIYLPLSLSTIPKPPSQIPQNPKRERERERERESSELRKNGAASHIPQAAQLRHQIQPTPRRQNPR